MSNEHVDPIMQASLRCFMPKPSPIEQAAIRIHGLERELAFAHTQIAKLKAANDEIVDSLNLDGTEIQYENPSSRNDFREVVLPREVVIAATLKLQERYSDTYENLLQNAYLEYLEKVDAENAEYRAMGES